MAESVGVAENCYTSQLSLAVGEEMVNETIECIYNNLHDISTLELLVKECLTSPRMVKIFHLQLLALLSVLTIIYINFCFNSPLSTTN